MMVKKKRARVDGADARNGKLLIAIQTSAKGRARFHWRSHCYRWSSVRGGGQLLQSGSAEFNRGLPLTAGL